MKENVKFLVKEQKKEGILFVSKKLEECVKFISKELRNRNKNDGYDEYWHKANLVIVRETITTDEICKV